jgi:membrane protease subunit HflC
MKSEREREAREHRSRGQELAEGIRASADRERTIIQSEAYRDAERLRGEGDAVAAQVYADAYNRNAEFYAFWRSLSAYENSFRNKSDVLLVSPDSDFFKYMESQNGKR